MGQPKMKRIFVGDKTGAGDDDLGISRAKVAGIIDHARIFDARAAGNDPDPNATDADCDFASILQDTGHDVIRREIVRLIRDMDVDEQASLVALAWIGRGTYSAQEWNEAVSQAKQAHNAHTAEYLLGLPLLADYLENGLAELDAKASAVVAPAS